MNIQVRTNEGKLYQYDITDELIENIQSVGINNIDKISFNIGDIDYRWLNENGVWINQPLSILTKLVYEKSKYAESQGDYDAIVKMCHEEFNYICNNTPEYSKSFEELIEFIQQNI
jgi:hypothetical protein